MSSDTGIVTLSVASREEIVARMKAAMHCIGQYVHITFPSVELLWKIVTSKRLEITRVMTGGESLSIREVSCRIGRVVRAVQADVRAQVNAGLVEDTGIGVRFGYEPVRVEFTLQAAKRLSLQGRQDQGAR